MYEVRPENSIHRVDSDTSLARAITKAENIAFTNRRRYCVVEVRTVHVAEPGPVLSVLPVGGKTEYVQGPDSAAPGDFVKHVQMIGRGTRKLPELVVTKDGVPFADQAEGVRQFKAAALDQGTKTGRFNASDPAESNPPRKDALPGTFEEREAHRRDLDVLTGQRPPFGHGNMLRDARPDDLDEDVQSLMDRDRE